MNALFGRNWLPVSAKLLEFKIKTGNSGGRHSRRYYEPVIRYEYDVGGFRYSGDRVDWRSRSLFDSEIELKEFLGNPNQNDVIIIKYNPRKPYESVLRDKVGGNPSGIIFMGLLLQLPAFIFIITKGDKSSVSTHTIP